MDYPWSNCRAHAGVADIGWLKLVAGSGRDYPGFVMGALADDDLALIREAVGRGQLTGDDRFVDAIERAIGRRIERRGPGRSGK